MEITEELIAATRVSILDLLRLLSDLEAQLDYERTVRIASVPAELVCSWFDDGYQPTSQTFQRAFGAAERAALAEFHSLFESACSELPNPLPGLMDLHKHTAWGRICTGARRALAQLPNAAA